MRRSPPPPTPPIAQAEEERRVLAEVSFGVTMRNLRLRYSAELCDTEVVDNACEQLGLPAPGRGRHPQAEGGTLLYGNYHGNYTGVEMKGSEI